ncbi:hypothetical protein BC830DRAFT_774645 [Chytriomyces sp. MP71]|nr:hypothetical protein BC830DRAFT_774645 [Chytriomyces sp. MP71]
MPLDAMPSASHATRLAGPLAGVGPSAAAVAESVAADPAPASETIPTLPVVFKDRSTLIENILCKWMQPRLQRILRVFVSVNLAPSTTEDIDEAVLAVLRDGIPVEQDAPLEAVVEEFALLVLAFHLPMLPRTFNLSNVEQINRKLHGGSETDQAHAERGWTFPLHANSCTWLAELPSFHQWTSDYDTPPEDLQSSFSDLDPNSGMDASIQASSGAMSPPAFLALVLDESYKAIFPQSNASGVSCDIDPDNVAAWDALASLTCFSRDCVEQFGLNKAFESNDSFTPLDRALAIIHMLQNMKPPATFSERAVLAVSSVRDYILHESVHYQFFSNPHIPYTYTIGVLVSIDSLFDPAGDSKFPRFPRA